MKRVAALKTRGKISPSRQDVSDTETRVFIPMQWSPVNTTTFGPWKFGRINVVVVLRK